MACACGKGACNCQPPTTVYLRDEHGTIHEFFVADRLRIGERLYAFAVAAEDYSQYALLRVEHTDEGRETFHNITSEAEWKEVENYLTLME